MFRLSLCTIGVPSALWRYCGTVLLSCLFSWSLINSSSTLRDWVYSFHETLTYFLTPFVTVKGPCSTFVTLSCRSLFNQWVLDGFFLAMSFTSTIFTCVSLMNEIKLFSADSGDRRSLLTVTVFRPSLTKVLTYRIPPEPFKMVKNPETFSRTGCPNLIFYTGVARKT